MRRRLATVAALSAWALLAVPGASLAAPSFAPLDADATGVNPAAVALADVDVDGDLDAVVTTAGANGVYAGELDVYRNDGAGALALDAAAHVALGGEARRVVVADVTGDGLPDALVTLGLDDTPGADPNDDGQVRILRGTSLGRFSTSSPIVLELGNGTRPTDLALGDVAVTSGSSVDPTGCDGRADVVVGDVVNNNGALFIAGSSPGTFAPGVMDNLGASATADGIALADLNGDGRLDGAATDRNEDLVVFLRGTCGVGPMSPSPLCRSNCSGFALGSAAAVRPEAAVAFDQDRDGDPDVLTTTGAPSAPRTALLTRTSHPGGVYAADPASGPELGFAQHGVAVADLNADAIPDLVWAGSSGAYVSTGAGTALGWPFDAPVLLAGPGGSTVDAVATATGDLDRDGRPDVVAVDGAVPRLVAWRGTTRFPDPLVVTAPATVVGETTATLNGHLDPRGLRVSYRFDYGPTTAYGQSTTAIVLPAGAAAADVLASITGLASGTTLHARLVATSQDRVVSAGDDVAFTTQAHVEPPPPLPAPAVSATLTTTVRFRESRVTGALVVAGTVTNAADGAVTARLLPAKGGAAIATARGATAQGALRLRLKLPATQAPGSFVVALAAPGPTTATLPFVLAAPKEGIVRQATIASFRGGPATTTLSGVRRTLWAVFRFSRKPTKGAVTVSWSRNGKAIRKPAPKPRATVVESTLISVAPLARGRYEAVLRAGPVVVFRVGVVLR